VEPAAILAVLPAAILVVTRANRIAFANGAAEELFGIGAAQLTETSTEELFAPFSAALDLITRARLASGPIVERDGELVLPRAGRAVSADLEAAPLEDGDAGAVVLAIRPSGIAARLDRQGQRRDSARSIGALAATLAHEVKNPLSGIKGAAQLLEQDARGPERELARMIQTEVDRIAALIGRIESFGEGAPLRIEPINIHAVLDHVRAVAAHGFARAATFRCVYDPSLPPVSGDRDELIRALLNLVKNAAEALPGGAGEITLATAYVPGLTLAASAGRPRAAAPICVTVGDDGAGVPERLKPRLFEPFVSGRPGGTGLGLALVAKIVDDHGGFIEFDSQPRRTQFRLYLPAATTEEAAWPR
jgi:two-component system nitrogen regulation sensor histidine kinase GlnL